MIKQNLIAAAIIATFSGAMAGSAFAVAPPPPADVQQEGEHQGVFGSDVNEPVGAPEAPEAAEAPGAPEAPEAAEAPGAPEAPGDK